MADTFVQLAADGAGKKVDTRTESTNGEHRQVFVIGDPATNAGVASVDATNGLSVNLTNASVTVGGTVTANAGTGTMAVSAASLPLPSGAATAAKQPALGTAGSSSTDVLSVQGVASGTALPMSAASLPLPTGASTSAAQTTGNTSLSSIDTKTPALVTGRVPVDGSAVTQPVSGTVTANAGTGTMAVSAASLPLPSGASTAAKQPALGTAGTPSADVLTVQGVTSMTALKTDGSGVTQPVSGTVTASQATATNLKTQAETYQGGVAVSAAAPLQVTLANTAVNATAVKVDGSAVTQPVSGTLTVNTHAVTQSGTWTVQPGNTANTTAWLVDEPGRSIAPHAALTTTATVSAAAGRYAGGSAINLNSAPAYIQVFDTTGAVTLGTTAPTFYQPIPANSTAANGAGYVFNIHPGVTMANGIKVAATTTATGATTVTTGLTGYTIYR